ncbi:triacylglycerol lipase [Amycolatopsis sp. MtRt-6]|uniref:esterase/lipase family protein n=1 Tax=Amycolatopsis sp. MtRt-6 TaxID=2792782 RepID=UPI001A8EFBE5|nr:hypothetical protein [Amycolatopsis sp. MtRt-6]
MSRAVVFVHGTGVRGESYARSFARIKAALPGGTQFSGCFWGATEGARLSAGGVSVPRYDSTRGERDAAAEEELALWAVLYTDPWYELRLLRYAGDEAENLPPGAVPPAVALRAQVEGFTPSDPLRTELAAAGLEQAFGEALTALVASPEFDDAAETAALDPVEHRKAVARAVLAHALVATACAIDGETRDALVERLIDELHGYGRGIGDWLARPLKGIAARTVTSLVGRRRGSVTDAVSPAAGDILRYQARGAGIRDAIRQAVTDSGAAEVALLAHSLGGIACVDLLVSGKIPEVDRLVTVGSQAPFLYEIGALASLEPPDPLPGHFPSWLNIYDPRDFLGYVGQEVFPGRVTDVEVDNRQPFPQAHSAYWDNRAVWAAVGEFLA